MQKSCHEDVDCVQEVPLGRNNEGVIINAKSDENGEVRVDILSGSSHFGKVHKLWHEGVGPLQEVPVGRNNGGVILNAKSDENKKSG